jgi:HD-like signal output (HDOD) protein
VSHKEEEIKAEVKGITSLSTIPLTLKRVLEVVGNEKSTRKDLVEVIEHDQSLSSKIIGMANTAFYGFNGEVRSISNASVVLGFNMIRNLAVSVSLFRPSSNRTNDYLGDLWRHSFEVAVASGLLADRTGLVKKEDAFLSGLIVDLGRVLLYQIHGEEYIKVAGPGREGLLEREREAFGATHSQIGAWFIDNYKFQKECVLALQLHHEPEAMLQNYKAGTLHMIAIVYIADHIVSGDNHGFEIDLIPSSMHEEILSAVYLDARGLDEVSKALKDMEGQINSFFSG